MAMGFQERDVISILQRIFATTDSRLTIGIGDDGAVIRTASESIITSDMAVEDIHFKVDWSSAFDIGRKITAANVADVLAMGGRCEFLTASVSLKGNEDLQWIEDLALGMRHEAALAGAIIVGGDISRGPKIVIAMTAIGSASHPIARSGAKTGDSIFISSLPGWSAAGLELLTREIPAESEFAERALAEFSAPTLDYLTDFSSASAMADISDSLVIQGQQIAEASGVQLCFDVENLASNSEYLELKSLAEQINSDVLQWIVAGGEDHVLLATGLNLPGICIGTVASGHGLVGIDKKMAPVSWSHF